MEDRERRFVMIKLKRIVNAKSNGYFYFPENKTEPGMIEINLSTGEVYIAEESSYDKELGVPYYANKALSEVKRLVKTNNLVNEKVLAWY